LHHEGLRGDRGRDDWSVAKGAAERRTCRLPLLVPRRSDGHTGEHRCNDLAERQCDERRTRGVLAKAAPLPHAHARASARPCGWGGEGFAVGGRRHLLHRLDPEPTGDAPETVAAREPVSRKSSKNRLSRRIASRRPTTASRGSVSAPQLRAILLNIGPGTPSQPASTRSSRDLHRPLPRAARERGAGRRKCREESACHVRGGGGGRRRPVEDAREALFDGGVAEDPLGSRTPRWRWPPRPG